MVEARFYLPAHCDLLHFETSEELHRAARELDRAGVRVLVLSRDPELERSSPLPLRRVAWSPYPEWVVRHFNFNDWTRFAIRSKNIYEWMASEASEASEASGR